MPALLRWNNDDGSAGQCDSRCHNAKLPECDCRCGGRFHGKGRNGTLQEALANTSPEELATLARTPNPLASCNRRRYAKPGTSGRRGTAAPKWRQTTQTHWTTASLITPPSTPVAHINLDEKGAYVLTVQGPPNRSSVHKTLEHAKQALPLLATSAR